MKLNDKQLLALEKVQKAWEARTEQMLLLEKRHAQERDDLQTALEDELSQAVADGLVRGVPKLRMAKAMGTKVYANRQAIHDAAMRKVKDVPVEQTATDLTREQVLKDKAAHAETWAQALTFEFAGTSEHGDVYSVQDSLDIVQEMFLDDSGPVSYDDTPGLARLIVLAEDTLTEKMESAKND